MILPCLLVPAFVSAPEPEFQPPVRLEADGKPLDVLGGHAAPSVADADGDGAPDLLVGQFLGEGKNPFDAGMRLYCNGATGKAPAFAGFRYLEGGGVRASVPTG